MKKLIIEKITGATLSVITNDGEYHTISVMNLINNTHSKMSISHDDIGTPKCELDIHLECDQYDLAVDYPR